MKHIVLLGDSIFDNKSYVRGGTDVIGHLKGKVPDSWQAELQAVDGSVVSNVDAQIARAPTDATHFVVSVGGNDALGNIDILQGRAGSNAEVFSQLAERSGAFERKYFQMMRRLLGLNKPVAVCTIYYPRMDDPTMQKIAVAALATFNDVIIKLAFLAGVPLIDLRLVCNEHSDYANEIEPSDKGGGKIANAITRLVNEHDFSRRRTEVFY